MRMAPSDLCIVKITLRYHILPCIMPTILPRFGRWGVSMHIIRGYYPNYQVSVRVFVIISYVKFLIP